MNTVSFPPYLYWYNVNQQHRGLLECKDWIPAPWNKGYIKHATWTCCNEQTGSVQCLQPASSSMSSVARLNEHLQASVVPLEDFGVGYSFMSIWTVYLPTHKITKYVQAIQVWRLTTPIDIASCNRFPHFVWICVNWKHIICRGKRPVTCVVLHMTPNSCLCR